MILVTGGTGYIGSHTCVELLQNGYDVVIIDNFCNSSRIVFDHIQRISGRSAILYTCDVRDNISLQKIFDYHPIEAVIHFAGLKSIAESITKPLLYHDNNVNGTISLLRVMQAHSVKKIVFSSSAAVYGRDLIPPYIEDMYVYKSTSAYGQTKIMIENILKALHLDDPEWSIMSLRYFNPAGAHESGEIGEDPVGIPSNLCPYITQVAIGKLTKVNIFGNDYPTEDGTCIRDYIHIVDLVHGHLAALTRVLDGKGFNIYNLGTGKGTSILKIIHAFEKTCGKSIPCAFESRREGDLASVFADVTKANLELGWLAKYGIDKISLDAWNWQKKNPNGY